jgi:hypothetical protein
MTAVVARSRGNIAQALNLAGSFNGSDGHQGTGQQKGMALVE